MLPLKSCVLSVGRRLAGIRVLRLAGVAFSVSMVVSCSLLIPPESGSASRRAAASAREAAELAAESEAAESQAAMEAAQSAAAEAAAQAAAASQAAASQAAASQAAVSQAAAQSAAEAASRAAASSKARAASSAAAAAPASSEWPSGGSVPSPLAVPNLDGTTVAQNDSAAIDLSYTSYGFVKIHVKSPSASRLKVIVALGGNKYTYDLRTDGGSESYPLQMGSGAYTIGVYRNISGDSYAQILSASADASLRSSTVPFLVPSQMVNYTSSGQAAGLARQLAAGKSNNYARISAVLSYVAQHIHYDQAKAASVRSGYVPDVDAVLNSGSGICFDYAAVSAAMLRSLGYPTKLVTGYIDNGRTYHAWNEVYLPGQGWIKVMAVTLNTADWSRVDVTFVSSATSPSDIEKYIGNGANYVKQYTY